MLHEELASATGQYSLAGTFLAIWKTQESSVLSLDILLPKVLHLIVLARLSRVQILGDGKVMTDPTGTVPKPSPMHHKERMFL